MGCISSSPYSTRGNRLRDPADLDEVIVPIKWVCWYIIEFIIVLTRVFCIILGYILGSIFLFAIVCVCVHKSFIVPIARRPDRNDDILTRACLTPTHHTRTQKKVLWNLSQRQCFYSWFHYWVAWMSRQRFPGLGSQSCPVRSWNRSRPSLPYLPTSLRMRLHPMGRCVHFGSGLQWH